MATLTDTIADLAARLREDEAVAYLQARIEHDLAAIEAILERGVSTRKLALALSDEGMRQADGRPLSHGNMRQLITRARRSRAHAVQEDHRPTAALARSTPSPASKTTIIPVHGHPEAIGGKVAAPDFSTDPLGLRRGR